MVYALKTNQLHDWCIKPHYLKSKQLQGTIFITILMYKH